MFMQTLIDITEMSNKDFAQWIIDYPFYEYWKKCKFNSFSFRIKDKGFWDMYKLLKENVKKYY